MNRGIGALLPAIPLWFALSAALAQVAGQVPAEVTAIKTERGITITSKASGDEFSLTVAGSDIRPLSQDRLKLKIDGRDVEIVTLPLGPDLVSKPDAEVLATYRIWVEHRLHDDGWQTIDASGADLSLPSGRSALLWRMQKQPPDPAQPSGLTIAASLNRHNVVALVGSYPDDNGQSALESYLRAALATLRAEEPAPPPKQEQTLAAGAGLRQILGLWSTLTGEEARALLNKRLMTEADNDLILATPAEPEVLMLGLRQAVQDAGAKAAFSTVVFDGKAAHVIVVVAYDGRAKAFTYMDPWRRGSFLAAGNNAAGLAATPHPTQPRHWIVKADQLKSVAYAVELPGLAIEHVAAVIPLGAFGPMGQTISDAQRTDLFTWFHLEQTATSKNAAGRLVTTFRPSAPQFRQLASLDVTVGASGRILAVDLKLLRSFIDDETNTVFARDFANSFLRAATSPRDSPWLVPLANQLRYDVQGMALTGKNQPPVTLPDQPTDDYLTFLGRKPQSKKQLSLTVLTLANTTVDGKPSLVVSLETVR